MLGAMSERPSPGAHHRPPGLNLIIAYKLAKAVIWLITASAIMVALHFGLTSWLRSSLLNWEAHLSHEWAIRLANWLVREVTNRHLTIAAVALLLDGVVSAVESYALIHGRPWGEWLVVIATGALLPLEIWSLISKPRVARAVVFLINLAVVQYLAKRIWERHEERKVATTYEPGA
jgi:uncharacterized membrane protein (DUF2068 family)